MKVINKVIISGGGTGGHIFPALAIAEELKKRFPNVELLFIGAEDKMEMQKIPQAGYKIEGLWISGINRSDMKQNILFPLKLISSLYKSYKIIKKFKPDIAIGTGGFASGPSLWIANLLNIPIFIQEQNSFPGITNSFLSKKAKAICVAYDNMEKFFPKENTFNTGNPVRKIITNQLLDKKQAKIKLGLNPNKLCVLSVGGSLGSRTLNDFWNENIENISQKDFQVIWQTGNLDFNKYKNLNQKNIGLITEFLNDMFLAYSCADIIISRAGAIAISELCIIGKPTILIPFPFASEDHQTKNALYLKNKNACILVEDKNVKEKLFSEIIKIIENESLQNELSENIKKLSKENSSKEILDIIISKI